MVWGDGKTKVVEINDEQREAIEGISIRCMQTQQSLPDGFDMGITQYFVVSSQKNKIVNSCCCSNNSIRRIRMERVRQGISLLNYA